MLAARSGTMRLLVESKTQCAHVGAKINPSISSTSGTICGPFTGSFSCPYNLKSFIPWKINWSRHPLNRLQTMHWVYLVDQQIRSKYWFCKRRHHRRSLWFFSLKVLWFAISPARYHYVIRVQVHRKQIPISCATITTLQHIKLVFIEIHNFCCTKEDKK